MKTCRRGWLLVGSLLVLATVLAAAQRGHAAAGPTSYPVAERYGLKGLQGFYIQVDRLPYEVEDGGLTKADIQRDIELLLRKGGAVVLTREQAADSPNAPRLHVRLLAGKPKNSPFYNYCVTMSFSQAATLTRDPGVAVDAITWHEVGLGMAKKKDLVRVREILTDMANDFLNAYLAENPK